MTDRITRHRVSHWVAVAASLLAAASANAAASLWEVVQQIEGMVPMNESKLVRELKLPMQKIEQGKDGTFYRSTAFKLDNGAVLDEVVYTPQQAGKSANVVIRLPVATARSTSCVSRAEVSREYGAPVRNWTSTVGGGALTHFEFERPGNRTRVAVAFSDATDCLVTLTVEETR